MQFSNAHMSKFNLIIGKRTLPYSLRFCSVFHFNFNIFSKNAALIKLLQISKKFLKFIRVASFLPHPSLCAAKSLCGRRSFSFRFKIILLNIL